MKRFPFQFFVYYSAVLITAFSAVDTDTYKVNDDEFDETRSSLMIQVATFMCVHVLFMYSVFVILHKVSARIKLFNFKFIIKNGTVANIQERSKTRDSVCCCIPVRRRRKNAETAGAYVVRGNVGDDDDIDGDDQGDEASAIASSAEAPSSTKKRTSRPRDRHGSGDVRIDMDAIARRGVEDAVQSSSCGSNNGVTRTTTREGRDLDKAKERGRRRHHHHRREDRSLESTDEEDDGLSPLHPMSIAIFVDTAVRKIYYDVRRCIFICGSVMYNDKDDDERQLYFGKAEALLRRMRALTGVRPETPPMDGGDSDMNTVMRSVSSVIVSATKADSIAVAHESERPRSADATVASAARKQQHAVASAALMTGPMPFSDAKIRQIQIRWRLRRAKRMLEKISAEKILGEIAMSQFNLDEEYGELMMVSGFVWILAAVFPLAPLLACLSCYVIIRGCTMKLLVSCRRPWPKKRYDIGSWCVERAPLLVTRYPFPHLFPPRPRRRITRTSADVFATFS